MARRPLPKCPNPRCGAASAGCVKHSILRTLQRSQRRYRCGSCGRTFAANVGTPYHRMRHPPRMFDQVVAMAVEGSTKAGIARALGLSASTVSRWIEKAAAHAAAFNDAKLQKVDAIELQADELKVQARNKNRPLWAYTSVEVWSRLWVTTRVGRRTLRNTLLHYRELAWRCRRSGPRTLITTDAFKYNDRVIARVFGPTCVYAQVVKRFKKGRVICTDRKLVIGPEWRLEEALDRSEDSKTINTSFVERLNLTIRRSLACLQRKTTAVCRSEESLTGQLDLLRCYYNFIRPHGSLKFGRVKRTPAQQAGLVPKPLSWRSIFTARLAGPHGSGFHATMWRRNISRSQLAGMS